MTKKTQWLEQSIRSQGIAVQIADLLNEIARTTPDIDAEIHGPGFCIRGHGGNFRVDSLLSTNDLREVAKGPGRDRRN